MVKCLSPNQSLVTFLILIRGVRDKATDDHMTIDICLSEVNRCLATSSAANFVFLSGQRYGWRALPSRVSASEFELVFACIPDCDGKTALGQWYLLDDNSVPPVYVLQNSLTMKQKNIPYNNFCGNKNENIPSAEALLQQTVRRALQESNGIAEDVKQNWNISVTEREVIAGLLTDDRATKVGGLVLIRTIEGLEEAVDHQDQQAAQFHTMVDEDRLLLNMLRERVKRIANPAFIAEFNVPWQPPDGISFDNHSFYVRNITSEFMSSIMAQIEVGLRKRKVLSATEKEAVHHHTFAAKRAKGFYGRKYIREGLMRLVEFEGPIVRCLHGLSGAGKTSAMARCAVDTREKYPNGGA